MTATWLKLLGRLGVSALPKLALASGNEECLRGTKAAFFDSGANLIPELGGRVSKIAGKILFIHETLLSRAVPQRHHCLLEVVPSKAQEIEVVMPGIHNEMAPPINIPIQGSSVVLIPVDSRPLPSILGNNCRVRGLSCFTFG